MRLTADDKVGPYVPISVKNVSNHVVRFHVSDLPGQLQLAVEDQDGSSVFTERADLTVAFQEPPKAWRLADRDQLGLGVVELTCQPMRGDEIMKKGTSNYTVRRLRTGPGEYRAYFILPLNTVRNVRGKGEWHGELKSAVFTIEVVKENAAKDVPESADSPASREKPAPHSIQYRGTCVRTEDGMPIEGAVVRFWLYGLSTREMTLWRITTTDAQGRFAIEGDIKSTDDIDLKRSRIAVTAPKRATRVFFWQDSTGEARLEMAPAASITGRVTDSKLQPIAGATVRVGSRRLPGVNDALTDAHGRFEIADLQAAEKLTFGMSNVLVVEHPEYDSQTATFKSVPISVDFVLNR